MAPRGVAPAAAGVPYFSVFKVATLSPNFTVILLSYATLLLQLALYSEEKSGR